MSQPDPPRRLIRRHSDAKLTSSALASYVCIIGGGGGMAPLSASHPLVNVVAEHGAARLFALDLQMRTGGTALRVVAQIQAELRQLAQENPSLCGSTSGRLRVLFIGYSTSGWIAHRWLVDELELQDAGRPGSCDPDSFVVTIGSTLGPNHESPLYRAIFDWWDPEFQRSQPDRLEFLSKAHGEAWPVVCRTVQAWFSSENESDGPWMSESRVHRLIHSGRAALVMGNAEMILEEVLARFNGDLAAAAAAVYIVGSPAAGVVIDHFDYFLRNGQWDRTRAAVHAAVTNLAIPVGAPTPRL